MSDQDKTPKDRAARLRRRVEQLNPPLTVDDVKKLLGILKGTLQLLEDEL